MEQMLEVRSYDGRIYGWLPPPRYPNSRYNNFHIAEHLPLGSLNYNLPPATLSIQNIQLEIDVAQDWSDGPSQPYAWKFYRSNVPIETLRKLRGFVENRPVDADELWERQFRHMQMIKLMNPPMIVNINGDIENMNIEPGGVVYIRSKDEVEKIRQETKTSKTKPKKKLLLLCETR